MYIYTLTHVDNGVLIGIKRYEILPFVVNGWCYRVMLSEIRERHIT